MLLSSIWFIDNTLGRFLEYKLLYFDSNFMDLYSSRPNWQNSIVSDNDLSPNRRQAIIRTNDGLDYWRFYASLRIDVTGHNHRRFSALFCPEDTQRYKHVIINNSWWRHQMEIFSALLAICAGNSPVSGEFPAQRPVTRSFDVFFDLRLNKRLSKQSWGWWFETLSLHHYDVTVMYVFITLCVRWVMRSKREIWLRNRYCSLKIPCWYQFHYQET